MFCLSNGILIKKIGQIARGIAHGSVLAVRWRVIRLFPAMETASTVHDDDDDDGGHDGNDGSGGRLPRPAIIIQFP